MPGQADRRSARDTGSGHSAQHPPARGVEDLARDVLRIMADQGSPAARADRRTAHVADLCRALLGDNAEDARARIDAARSDGAPLEEIYLDHLAGAARMLGDWWTDGRVSFTEVTLATSRIYAIMRALRYQMTPGSGVPGRRAVFAAVPGETHTLGLRMAADLCRMSGWHIDLRLGLPQEDLLAEIVALDAPIIGLSAGGVHAVAPLARLVSALRLRCPAARLFVSGPVATEEVAALAVMDLDGVAEDLDAALRLMERFRAPPARPR